MMEVWLIERETCEWWSVELQAWTSDPWAATRYATEQSCWRAILFLGLTDEGRAVAHGFGL